MISNIGEIVKIIKDSNNVVFFGGAGVSTESEIPDFRFLRWSNLEYTKTDTTIFYF